jgi:DNA invertase Pin-like site-specific DNA recombinase
MCAEEKRKILARTQEGLAKARRHGTKSGKPIGRPPEITPALAHRITQMHTRDNLSAYAIAQKLTASGEPTPRGGAKWYPTTVIAVIEREQLRELEDAS